MGGVTTSYRWTPASSASGDMLEPSAPGDATSNADELMPADATLAASSSSAAALHPNDSSQVWTLLCAPVLALTSYAGKSAALAAESVVAAAGTAVAATETALAAAETAAAAATEIVATSVAERGLLTTVGVGLGVTLTWPLVVVLGVVSQLDGDKPGEHSALPTPAPKDPPDRFADPGLPPVVTSDLEPSDRPALKFGASDVNGKTTVKSCFLPGRDEAQDGRIATTFTSDANAPRASTTGGGAGSTGDGGHADSPATPLDKPSNASAPVEAEAASPERNIRGGSPIPFSPDSLTAKQTAQMAEEWGSRVSVVSTADPLTKTTEVVKIEWNELFQLRQQLGWSEEKTAAALHLPIEFYSGIEIMGRMSWDPTILRAFDKVLSLLKAASRGTPAELRAQRETLKWTAEQAANFLEIPKPMYVNFENGPVRAFTRLRFEAAFQKLSALEPGTPPPQPKSESVAKERAPVTATPSPFKPSRAPAPAAVVEAQPSVFTKPFIAPLEGRPSDDPDAVAARELKRRLKSEAATAVIPTAPPADAAKPPEHVQDEPIAKAGHVPLPFGLASDEVIAVLRRGFQVTVVDQTGGSHIKLKRGELTAIVPYRVASEGGVGRESMRYLLNNLEISKEDFVKVWKE
jgi:hypothetical protein